VARWWHHETSAEAVERDVGPIVRREEPNEDLLAFLDGEPLGLVQRSFLHGYPEYLNAHRDAECVIVAVHADNIGSWRAL